MSVYDEIADQLKENGLWVQPPKKYRGRQKSMWNQAMCRSFNQFSILGKRRNLVEVFNEVRGECENYDKKYHIIASRIRRDPRYKASHFRDLVSRRNQDCLSRLDLIISYHGAGTLDRVIQLMDANRFHHLKTSNCLAVQEFINKIE